MQLLRDESGKFTIPGSSIAGAARSRLALDFAGRFADGIDGEPGWMRALFGGGKPESGTMSALSISDCDPIKHASGNRDGVAISHETGQAEDQARYVIEVLPVGTKFVLRLELRVFDAPAVDVATGQMLSGFRTLLELLSRQEDGVWLGAKTRAGFGRGHVESWKVAVLDMTKKEDVSRWLRRGLRRFDFHNDETLEESLNGVAPLAPETNARKFTVNGTFRLKTSMIIRSHSTAKNEPDFHHLTERRPAAQPGQTVDCYPVPGTSLRGPFRKRCRKILLTLDWPREQADELIDGLFGPRFGGKHGNKDPRASRVVFEESALEDVELRVQGRVAIDRFTQAALDSCLFQEAAAWPKSEGAGKMRLHCELRNPKDCEVAVLLLALKDLCLADLPVGGEAGVGRGVFSADDVTSVLLDGKAEHRLQIARETKVSSEDVKFWNEYITKLKPGPPSVASQQGGPQ
jgi:CRISPR/Cas system CSM-associated protein Csm3 (group 7 of RAMP superfamily)